MNQYARSSNKSTQNEDLNAVWKGKGKEKEKGRRGEEAPLGVM